MNSLLHITPQLPPAIDGVGDYCWNLWRHWPEPLPNWKFLVTRGAQEAAARWPEVPIAQFEPSRDSLHAALERSGCAAAVLHYVGYGYQPKGIPVWLPGAIAEWKKSGAQRRVFTMFHEMYARSSPLRSPFWIAPVARKIIRELLGLSDAWVTSCERYFKQLTREFSASAELGRIIPIGSNIPVVSAGKPKEREDEDRKHFRFVVFGLAKTRLWALERHWRLLRALNEAGAIEFITLLGKRHEPADERAWLQLKNQIGANVNWRTRFDLSTDEISRELAAHDFGLLANEPDILTKSGVFAALASHGTVPIVSMQAQQNLPSSVSGAAIANDDDVEAVPHLTRLLGDTARCRELREKLIEFSTRELAWRHITENWSGLLSASRALTGPEVLAVRRDESFARSQHRSAHRKLVAPT